jgi:hypothetical protein
VQLERSLAITWLILEYSGTVYALVKRCGWEALAQPDRRQYDALSPEGKRRAGKIRGVGRHHGGLSPQPSVMTQPSTVRPKEEKDVQ